MAIWRCISYWTWGIFQPAMFTKGYSNMAGTSINKGGFSRFFVLKLWGPEALKTSLLRWARGSKQARRNGFILLFLPQSWKWKMAVFERWLPLEGPIFHFHDYGRKCRWFEFWGFCRICNMSRQRNPLSLLNIFLETSNLGFLDPQVTLIRPVKRLVGSIRKDFREEWALRFHLWVKHEHLC